MTHVRLSHVSKAYGKHAGAGDAKAVEDLSLDIRSSEFFIFLGPSGCGKTSTLRMIAGLETITEGTITLDERVVNRVAPGQRNLGMAFESYALYPPLSVYENLAYGLKARRIPAREIDQRVREVTELLEMEGILQQYPRQLSGGQQQLVSLARALVRSAPLLLLDEPLSHLEPARRFRVRTAVKDFTTRAGMTVIYVTHDQVEATALADHIAVMSMGHLQQVGTPAELWSSPTNRFVAGFIGEPPMNFFSIDAFSDGREKVFAGSERSGARSYSSSEEITVGVRPQDLFVVEGAISSDMLVLDSVVHAVQWLGHEIQLFCQVASAPVIIVLPPATQTNFPLGTPLKLGMSIHNIHLFDAQGAHLDQAQKSMESRSAYR
jgi:multiple sugar transport system ATP-binding protein